VTACILTNAQILRVDYDCLLCESINAGGNCQVLYRKHSRRPLGFNLRDQMHYVKMMFVLAPLEFLMTQLSSRWISVVSLQTTSEEA